MPRAALVATMLAGLLCFHVRAQQPAPFMLGVLGVNGDLTPIVHYADGAWTMPWRSYQSVPETVEAIPSSWWPGFSAQGWRVALPDGEKPLRILAPYRTAVDCGSGWSVGLKTDDAPGYIVNPFFETRAAFTGSAVLRGAESQNKFGAYGAVWDRGEELLRTALGSAGRPAAELAIEVVSRLPREDGTNLWFVEAYSRGRRVDVWASDGSGNTFVHLEDTPGTPDHEQVGALTPLATIWGFGGDVVFGRETLHDGGTYQVLSIAPNGARELFAGGGSSC